MAYFKVCPHCRAHLDPGEACDCREKLKRRVRDLLMQLSPEQLDQVIKEWEKDTASGATNTRDGKTEQIKTPVSVSIIPTMREASQV